MTHKQAKAEYDFEAQPSSGELTIRTGEILIILREDIEGGWVEGKNSKGKVGLFPASYVQMLESSGVSTTQLMTTPRGSICIIGAQPSLRRSSTMRRSQSITHSRQRIGITSMNQAAKHVALATLSPALLNSGPPPSVPPPLPSLPHNPAPTYSMPPSFDKMTLHSAPMQSAKQKVVSPPLQGLDAWDNPTVSEIGPSYTAKRENAKRIGAADNAEQCQEASDFDDDWSEEDESIAVGNVNSRQSKSDPKSHQGLLEDNGELEIEVQKGGKADALTRRQSSDIQSDFEEPSPAKGTDGGQEFSSSLGGDKSLARSQSVGPDPSKQLTGNLGTATARMKNINRFSNFVKTGLESYILASSKFNTQPGETHEIAIVGNQVEWRRPEQYHTCTIAKPKKESKLKGLKSFIAYSLTSSDTGILVSRRYKHFDWLHGILESKYLFIPIPPLPEKQVAGLYEEDLIKHRLSILQLWVNKISRHPVLSKSEVWSHFLGCTDENKWKKGKRLAEKDEYVGGNFFNCIVAPTQALDLTNVERQVEQFGRSSRALEESCRALSDRLAETQKRLIGPYKANWQKLAQGFDSLGQSLDIDQAHDSSVKMSIKTSAHMLHKIGSQHEEHGKHDLEHLLNFLYVCKGISSSIPETVNVLKTVHTKMRDNERLMQEGKISTSEADMIRSRVDTCSYAMLAEMAHQREERDLDLSTALGAFFSQQAAFYHNLGNQFTQLAALYKPK